MILLSGCKPKFEGEEYEAVYTCEVVEDITQEEIVCFDNLLFDYGMSRDWRIEGEKIGVYYDYLFVFEDGSVYCGTEQFRDGNVVHDIDNCNDEGWFNLEDVYYLGKFSGENLWEMNCFIEDIDYEAETIYYNIEHYEYRFDLYSTEESGYENLNQRDWNSMGFLVVYENRLISISPVVRHIITPPICFLTVFILSIIP